MDFSLQKVSSRIPWTNTYGLARSTLAMGTLLTLVFNDMSHLFKPISASLDTPACDSLGISIFCLLGIGLGRVAAVIVLAVVIIGWRPRITGILHWWVMYSFINSATVLDGGDHIAAIISLLLVPLTLTDSRRSHWQRFETLDDFNMPFQMQSIVAQTTIVIIKVQIAIIYLNAAVSKISVTEWSNGTAVYYWFKHPMFGYTEGLGFLLEPLVYNRFGVMAISWGTIALELTLFAGLFMDKRLKRYVFIIGVAFHFGILVVHGLVSFFFSMTACLILLLGPSFTYVELKKKVNKLNPFAYV